MKHLTFALGLLGLCSAAAAQSSVTIYGIIDSQLTRGTGSLTSRSGLSSGGNMTSRIGFRGIEDLGRGLKAGFVLESQVFVDTGEGQPTNSNNQPSGAGSGAGMSFARRSTVSLMGGFGELRLGRDFTAHYRNRVEVDPFGNAGVGAAQPFVGSIGGVVSTRASNMVGYFLPSNLGGIYGQVQAYLGENTSGAANSKDGTGETIRIGYAGGPVNLSLSHGRTRYATTATIGDITSQNLGVQYTIGTFRLMGGLYRDQVARTVANKGKGWTLATLANISSGDLKLSLSEYETQSGTSNPTVRKLAAGYVHAFSKRTVAYLTVAHVSNAGGATTALNGSTTAANKSSTGADLGLRHQF